MCLVKIDGDGNIDLKTIRLCSNMGVVYIVDKVFTTPEEIDKVLTTFGTPITSPGIARNPFVPEGHFTPVKVDAEDVKKVAQFAVKSMSSNQRPISLVKIISAEVQQNVSGINYYKMFLKVMGHVDWNTTSDSEFQICEIVVLDKSLQEFIEMIKFHCANMNKSPTAVSITWQQTTPPNYRKTNQSSYLESWQISTRPNDSWLTMNSSTTAIPLIYKIGGYSPANVEDNDIKEMATFAVTTMSSSENMGPLSLVKIIKVEKQIVAGINFKMTLGLVRNVDSNKITCEVVVFDRSWTKTRKLSQSKCSANPMSRKKQFSLAGSFTAKYVDSGDVKEVARFAEASLSSSENKGPLSLAKIVTAETQVMNGLNYKLVLEFIQKVDYKPLTCEVVVYDQSWTDTRRMVRSKCFSP